jgi:cytochrome c
MRSLIVPVLSLAAAAVLLDAVYLLGNTYLFGTPLPQEPVAKVIVAATPGAPGGAPVADAKPFDYATYVPNVGNGEKILGKCKACHSFGNGEPNRVAPNMFGIVGRPVAAHEGYAYSPAMQAKAKDFGTWTDEHLFAYLENPKGVVPGTKMAFAGIKDPAQRADLIAYLKTLK